MKKVLVIEDDKPVRDNIKQLLERAGYVVVTAECGTEGIVCAAAEMPDIIICDIMMPGMNGYEVLSSISSGGPASAIPFIFLTARAEMSDLRHGMDLGADDYLIKPFRAADLLSAIKIRLEKKENILREEKKQLNNKASTLKPASVVMAGNPPEVLRIASIVFINADKGYSSICTKDGRKLLVRKLMKEWESILPEDLFLRIHNSTIINLEQMQRVEKWFNNTLRIYMRNSEEPLEVSKRYSSKVKARLKV